MGMDSPQGTLRVWIDNGDFVSPETFRAAFTTAPVETITLRLVATP